MSFTGIRGPIERRMRTAAKRVLSQIVRRSSQPREDPPLSTWGMSRDDGGSLSVDGVALTDLLACFGSPLHVVDELRLSSNAARFLAHPPGASHGCEVYASYKTNPIPGVLSRLNRLGVGAEAASPYELWLALRLGVHPASIVYDGPAKSEESLTLAVERGVGLINVNARSEIAPLAALAQRLGKTQRIGIRVVPPGRVGAQFGEQIATGAALEAYRHARSFPALRVCALHAHFNGEIASQAQLDGYLTALLAFADQLYSELGLEIEILDLGGNLACPTIGHLSRRAIQFAVSFGLEPRQRPPQSVLSIERYIGRIVERVDAHYASRRRAPPRIFLEPGRALMGDAQMLLCKVLTVRESDAGIRLAVLDVGINVAEPVRNEAHYLLPLVLRGAAPARIHRLVGPTCTLADQLYPAWRMPAVNAGDGLAIMDSGAYFVASATDFSFPRPAIVALAGNQATLLRHAETFDDLVGLDAVDGVSPPLRS